jgi:hypothetical protein
LKALSAGEHAGTIPRDIGHRSIKLRGTN